MRYTPSDMTGKGLLFLALLLYWGLEGHVWAALEEEKVITSTAPTPNSSLVPTISTSFDNATNSASQLPSSTSAQPLTNHYLHDFATETSLLEPLPLSMARDIAMGVTTSTSFPYGGSLDRTSAPVMSIRVSSDPLGLAPTEAMYATSTLPSDVVVGGGSSLLLPQSQPFFFQATSTHIFPSMISSRGIEQINPSPVFSQSSLLNDIFVFSSFISFPPSASQDSTSFLSASTSTSASQEVNPTSPQFIPVFSSQLEAVPLPTMTQVLQPYTSEPEVQPIFPTVMEISVSFSIPVLNPSLLMPFFSPTSSVDMSISSSLVGSLLRGQQTSSVPVTTGSDGLGTSSELLIFMSSDATSSPFLLVPTSVLNEPGATSQMELLQSPTTQKVDFTSTSTLVEIQASLSFGLMAPTQQILPTSAELLIPSLEISPSTEHLLSFSVIYSSESALPDMEISKTIFLVPTLSLSKQIFPTISVSDTSNSLSQGELISSSAQILTTIDMLPFLSAVTSASRASTEIDESTTIVDTSEAVFPTYSLRSDLIAPSTAGFSLTTLSAIQESQLQPSHTSPFQLISSKLSLEPSSSNLLSISSSASSGTSTTFSTPSAHSTSTLMPSDPPLPSPSPVTPIPLTESSAASSSRGISLHSQVSTTRTDRPETSFGESTIQMETSNSFVLMPDKTSSEVPITISTMFSDQSESIESSPVQLSSEMPFPSASEIFFTHSLFPSPSVSQSQATPVTFMQPPQATGDAELPTGTESAVTMAFLSSSPKPSPDATSPVSILSSISSSEASLTFTETKESSSTSISHTPSHTVPQDTTSTPTIIRPTTTIAGDVMETTTFPRNMSQGGTSIQIPPTADTSQTFSQTLRQGTLSLTSSQTASTSPQELLSISNPLIPAISATTIHLPSTSSLADVLSAQPTSLAQTPTQPLLSPSSSSDTEDTLTPLWPVMMETLSLLVPLSMTTAPTEGVTSQPVQSTEHMTSPLSTHSLTASRESTTLLSFTISPPALETSEDAFFPDATSHISTAILPSLLISRPLPSETQTDVISTSTTTVTSPRVVPTPSPSETETSFNTFVFSELFPHPSTHIASLSLLQPEDTIFFTPEPTPPLPSLSVIENILTSVQLIQSETLSLLIPFSRNVAPSAAHTSGFLQSSEQSSSSLSSLAESTVSLPSTTPPSDLDTSADILFPEVTSQISDAILTSSLLGSEPLSQTDVFAPSRVTGVLVSPTTVSQSAGVTVFSTFFLPELFPSSSPSTSLSTISSLLQPEQPMTATQPLLSPSTSPTIDPFQTSLQPVQLYTLSLLLPFPMTITPVEASTVALFEQLSSQLIALTPSTESTGLLSFTTSHPGDVLFPDGTSLTPIATPTPFLSESGPLVSETQTDVFLPSISTEIFDSPTTVQIPSQFPTTSVDILFPEITSQILTPSSSEVEFFPNRSTGTIFPSSSTRLFISSTEIPTPPQFQTELLTPITSELLPLSSLSIFHTTSIFVFQTELSISVTQPPPEDTVSMLEPFFPTSAPVKPSVEITILQTETSALLSPVIMTTIPLLSPMSPGIPPHLSSTQPQPHPSTSFIQPLLSPFPSDTVQFLTTFQQFSPETSSLQHSLSANPFSEPSVVPAPQSTERILLPFSTVAPSIVRSSTRLLSELFTNAPVPTADSVTVVTSTTQSESGAQIISFTSATASEALSSPSPSPSSLPSTFSTLMSPAPLPTPTPPLPSLSTTASSIGPTSTSSETNETLTEDLLLSTISNISLPFTLVPTPSLFETNTSFSSPTSTFASEVSSLYPTVVTTTTTMTLFSSQTSSDITLISDPQKTPSDLLVSSETPVLSSAVGTRAVLLSITTATSTSIIPSLIVTQPEAVSSVSAEIDVPISNTTSMQSAVPIHTSATRDVGTETADVSPSTPTVLPSSSDTTVSSTEPSTTSTPTSALMTVSTRSPAPLLTPTPEPACTQHVLDMEPSYPYLVSISLAFTESEHNAIVTPGSPERCSLEDTLTVIFKNGLMRLRGEEEVVRRHVDFTIEDHGKQRKIQSGQNTLKTNFSLEKRQTTAEDYTTVVSEVGALDSGITELLFYILNLTSTLVPVPATTVEAAFGRIQVSHVDTYPVIREVAVVESSSSGVCISCIAGGVVGGVVLLLIVAAVFAVIVLLIFWKQKHKGEFPIQDSSTVTRNRSVAGNNTFETTDPLHYEPRPMEPSDLTPSERSRRGDKHGVTMAELAHSNSHVSQESIDRPDPNIVPTTFFERVAHFDTPVPSPHVRPLQARLRHTSPLTPPRISSPTRREGHVSDNSPSEDEVKPKDTKKVKTGVSARKVLKEVIRQQKDEENQELWDRRKATLEQFKQMSRHDRSSRSNTRIHSPRHKKRSAGTKRPSTFGGRLLYSEEGESRVMESDEEGDTDIESPPSATLLSDLPASPKFGTRKRVKVRKKRSRIAPKWSNSDDEDCKGQHKQSTSHSGKQHWMQRQKFKFGRSQRVQPLSQLPTSGRQSCAVAQRVHREFAWMESSPGAQLMSIQPVEPVIQSPFPHPPPEYVLPPQLPLSSPPIGQPNHITSPDPSSVRHQMHPHHAIIPKLPASTQQAKRIVEGDDVTEAGDTLLSGVDSIDGGVVRVKPGSYLSKSEGDLKKVSGCMIEPGGSGKDRDTNRVGDRKQSIGKQPPALEHPLTVTSEKLVPHPTAADDGEGGNESEVNPMTGDVELPLREEYPHVSMQEMLQQAFQVPQKQENKQKVYVPLRRESETQPGNLFYGSASPTDTAWQTQPTAHQQSFHTSSPDHSQLHYTHMSIPEGQGELVWNPDSSVVEPTMPMMTAAQLTHLRSESRPGHCAHNMPLDDGMYTGRGPLFAPQHTSTPRPRTRHRYDITEQ